METHKFGSLLDPYAKQTQVHQYSETAGAIIVTAGITLERNKNMCISYDEKGYKYILPISVVNYPEEYEVHDEVKVEPLKESDIKNINVTIRASVITSDPQITISNNMKILDLINIFKETLKKEKINYESVRLFYNGKELKPNDQIYIYGIDGKIIQAFVLIKTLPNPN